MAAQSLPRIQRDVIAEVIRQLQIAQGRVIASLAAAKDDAARARLTWQRDEIRRALDAFRASATTSAVGAARKAWIEGKASIDRPIAAAGAPIAPRIDGRTLVAMENFLTGRIKDVSREALEKINEALAQHVLGTRSLSETITEVQRILGSDSRRRAMTIVYTEIGRVHSAAQYQAMLQQAKLIPGLKKRWRKSGKKHPRAGHAIADGQTVLVEDPFEIIVDLKTGEVEQLLFPRDPRGSPKNTINCGCQMVPELPESFAPAPTPGPASEPAAETPDEPEPTTVVPPAATAPEPVRPVAQIAPPRIVRDVVEETEAAPVRSAKEIAAETVQQILGGMDVIARGSGKHGRARVRAMWTDLDSFSQHVAKRMRAGDVGSGDELLDAVLATLSAATQAQVALGAPAWQAAAQFQLLVDGWVVLVNRDGRIVTAFPQDPDFLSFAEWNAAKGIEVHDYALTPADRKILVALLDGR